MSERRARLRRWAPLVLGVGLAAIIGLGLALFWGDVMRTTLDPKTPFQTYRPPRAPNYAERGAWALLPTRPQTVVGDDPSADVFFLGPTTYEGGRDWNAPIDQQNADRDFKRVMAPNYAGPFVRLGRIFAPRYRQASLYTLLTLREDAREARAFAYRDVAAAFRWYRDHDNQGRPFIIVGVEQGGTLASRLIAEEVAPDPALRARLAVAYLIETVEPAGHLPLPACIAREQAGCVAAWVSIRAGDIEAGRIILDRALVWTPGGTLENLGPQPALCFNPLLGATTSDAAPARLNQGAANATGLEWGARPAFMARQVSARCVDGVLQVSRPKSASLNPTGSWIKQRKAPGYNLFYADLESDARGRLAALPNH